MANQHLKGPRLGRAGLVAALAIMVGWPANAQVQTADAPQQWQSLNEQVIEIYRAGTIQRAPASPKRR